MKVVVFTLLCLYFVQGNADPFNDKLTEIDVLLENSITDFTAFEVDLVKDIVALHKKMKSIREEIQAFASTEKGENLICAQKLIEEIAALEKEMDITLGTDPAVSVIINIHEEFMDMVRECKDDLRSYREFYNCQNDECREKFWKLAEAQLQRAIGGSRAKEIKQKMVDAYPPVAAIIVEYDREFNTILNEFGNCKSD